jgi:polysaccharide biosynthesis transport protein
MEEKEITLQDIIQIVRRRKWTIAIVFTVVVGLAVYYAFIQPPEYRAEATFIIESSDVVFPGAAQLKMKETVRPFEFYQAVVKSKSFIEEAAKGLVDSSKNDPDMDIGLADAFSLIRKLEITNSDYEDFIQLEAVAYTPRIAFLLAEIGTQTLKERCQEIDQEEYLNVVDFVDGQKRRALKELEEIERNLQEYLKNTDTAILNDEEGGILKKLMDLEDQLTAVQTEKEVALANLRTYEKRLGNLESQLTDKIGQNEIPAVESIRNELTALGEQKTEFLQQYSKDHPALIAIDGKIEKKKKELIQLLLSTTGNHESNVGSDQPNYRNIQELKITEELKLDELKNRERYYLTMIDGYKKRHPNMLEHAIKIAQLNRAKTVQQNLYSFLLEKGEEARIKGATGTGGIRIIDTPTIPNDPIPTRTKKILMLALLVGLVAGFGLAYLQEYLDNSIKSTDDVTRYLDLPVMGVIPIIKQKTGIVFKNGSNGNGNGNGKIVHIDGNGNGNSNGNGHSNGRNGAVLISHLKSKDPQVEAYRGLRTNLQFSSVDEPIRALMVTSSLPGEGKTVTSANLAISFAQMGLKTILVDADLRKPQQHRQFKIDKSPGLLECLMEEVSLDEIMYETGVLGLKLIPSGLLPPNPAEVLNSRKMHNLVKDLKTKSDIVIFDTPPVIAVTDPLILGKQMDGILLVIRYQNTELSAAQKAMQVIKGAKLKIFGAVVNHADFNKGPDYYHYYHNYYGDSDNYTSKSKIVLN